MRMASLTRVALLFLSFSLLWSIQPAHAEERSFQISEVDIHARIDKVGDMHVAEVDTYHFDGAFNGIIVELDNSQSEGIVNFQAVEISGKQHIPLRSELTSSGNKLEYRVYSQSTNETKVFRLAYTVKNAVQVYADTAELYWKFFDSRNPSTLGNVNILVELPGKTGTDEITAFGHGPDYGHVQVEGNGTVRYEVSPLAAGELLEARVLFPVNYVPGSTRVSTDFMLDKILKQEKYWAEGDPRSFPAALALLILNLVGGIYLKYGNIFRKRWKTKYYRELPGDVTPAVVGFLKRHKVKPQVLMATMVDLVRKQRVRMHQTTKKAWGRDKVNYSFQLLDAGEDGLVPHEVLLINWFFREIGDGEQVSLKQIRKYVRSRKNADAFRGRWQEWQKEVAQATTVLGYVQNRKWVRLFVQCMAFAQFFGIWFFASENWNWLMFYAIPLFFLIPKKIRRTNEGQREYEKWKAFRRFLNDYSQIASREPLAVHLWEHYFVYAIPLGVAKKMIAITRLEIPGEVQDRTYIDSSYLYHYESWTDSFKDSIRTMHSSGSSSSDSGGSFSSGGGGGGGGGGRGAF